MCICLYVGVCRCSFACVSPGWLFRRTKVWKVPLHLPTMQPFVCGSEPTELIRNGSCCYAAVGGGKVPVSLVNLFSLVLNVETGTIPLFSSCKLRPDLSLPFVCIVGTCSYPKQKKLLFSKPEMLMCIFVKRWEPSFCSTGTPRVQSIHAAICGSREPNY